MAKRVILGETQELLKILPAEQLIAFAKIKQNGVMFKALLDFVGIIKQIKMDRIYRLRRPKTIDDTVKNAVEHDYYCGNIVALVLILQLIENAGEELERRERRSK